MFRKLIRFVEEEKLFYRDDKILVAVSGGIDSVVLLHLLKKMEINCAVAHCNFHLRGDESDGDFDFVQNLTKNYGIPFFSIDFYTKEYAAKNKLSIEMAARELRYNWFDKICKSNSYKYIAVGHHADDVAETVLINLVRGTGIHGLSGIKSKLGKIVRPLLPFTRKELEQYAIENNLSYREDSTNKETDFVRNKIRHQVMPVLEKINPAIRNTMSENVSRFREVEEMYNHLIDKNSQHLLIKKENKLLISISELKEVKGPVSHLHEILSPYGFHHRDVKNIVDSIYATSGKMFYSSTHQLLRDRKYLILTKKQQNNKKEYSISESEKQLILPVKLNFTFINRTSSFKFSKDSNIACFDADKLKFPLTLRKWQKGDTFCPIGMKGNKKISDFFIDKKFTIQEKENTWLLCSDNKIIWVVGHRMDNRVKITDETTKIYRLEMQRTETIK